jgi:hypothetical protein
MTSCRAMPAIPCSLLFPLVSLGFLRHLFSADVSIFGKPISWKELMLENPLSSSVVEKRFVDFVTFFAERGQSSAIFWWWWCSNEFESSVVLSKLEHLDFIRLSAMFFDASILSEFLFSSFSDVVRIGSWVLRKFWTVRRSRKPCFDSFSTLSVWWAVASVSWPGKMLLSSVVHFRLKIEIEWKVSALRFRHYQNNIVSSNSRTELT